MFEASTVADLGKGSEETITRLEQRKIPVNWRERLRLERGMLRRVRPIMDRMVTRVFNAEWRKHRGEASETKVDDARQQFQEKIAEVIIEYSQRAYRMGARDAIAGVDAVVQQRVRRLTEAEAIDYSLYDPIDYSLYDPIGEEEMEERAFEFGQNQVEKIGETVWRTAVDTIQHGVQQGLSVREIQELLKHKHDIALGRSEVIVRTTIVKSSNLGRMDQTKKMGIRKVELVGCDPDCEECQAVIAANPYSPDEARKIEMGLHPNHTGSWVPIVSDADLETELNAVINQLARQT
jgi:ribosomal protein S8E